MLCLGWREDGEVGVYINADELKKETEADLSAHRIQSYSESFSTHGSRSLVVNCRKLLIPGTVNYYETGLVSDILSPSGGAFLGRLLASAEAVCTKTSGINAIFLTRFSTESEQACHDQNQTVIDAANQLLE